MKRILEYLEEAYAPEGILLYGSYAAGTQGEGSDFDALVVTTRAHARHDESVVDGVTLDVFLYAPEELRGAIDCEAFAQIADGRVLKDRDGMLAALQAQVREGLERLPRKSPEENRQQIAWCGKMLERTVRGDAEGLFRWHWLLADSLEIYCDARGWRYRGPKKELARMQAEAPEAFAVYQRALAEMSREALGEWIDLLGRLI